MSRIAISIPARICSLVNDFILALEKELLFYRKNFPAVATVYLGGGTPTVLPDDALAAILAMVHRHVAVAPDAESTIEANPNDLSRERSAPSFAASDITA